MNRLNRLMRTAGKIVDALLHSLLDVEHLSLSLPHLFILLQWLLHQTPTVNGFKYYIIT